MQTRIANTRSFAPRLAEVAVKLKEKAKTLPIGKERENLLRRARQTETASDMNEWLRSPGLQPPK
jgi:hypothetical protein